MKRAGRIFSLLVILVMLVSMMSLFAYADVPAADGTVNTDNAVSVGKLSLTKSYPKDGGKDAAIENLGVKLYFEGTFTEEVLGDTNDDKVQLYGPEGQKLPTILVYSPTEEGVVLVLLDTTAEYKDGKPYTPVGNSDYKLSISGDFVDNNNESIGTATTVSFKTLNQKRSSTVYMLMTFAMFGGIMLFSMKGSKKKEDEEDAKKSDVKVNPYKEAKRTGKSVEEIVERDQRNKEKAAAKEAKRIAREEAEYAEYYDDDEDDWLEEGHYRVKGPRPISAAGSTYITGRKAEAEKKALEEKERKELEAKWAQQSKKKGKKKK